MGYSNAQLEALTILQREDQADLHPHIKLAALCSLVVGQCIFRDKYGSYRTKPWSYSGQYAGSDVRAIIVPTDPTIRGKYDRHLPMTITWHQEARLRLPVKKLGLVLDIEHTESGLDLSVQDCFGAPLYGEDPYVQEFFDVLHPLIQGTPPERTDIRAA